MSYCRWVWSLSGDEGARSLGGDSAVILPVYTRPPLMSSYAHASLTMCSSYQERTPGSGDWVALKEVPSEFENAKGCPLCRCVGRGALSRVRSAEVCQTALSHAQV